MKNQNDLIMQCAALFVALVLVAVFFFTKRQVTVPTPPTAVPTADAKIEAGAVTYANSLPGASGGGSNAAGGSGGRAGMPPGMFGPGGMGMGGGANRPAVAGASSGGGSNRPAVAGASSGGGPNKPGVAGASSGGGNAASAH